MSRDNNLQNAILAQGQKDRSWSAGDAKNIWFREKRERSSIQFPNSLKWNMESLWRTKNSQPGTEITARRGETLSEVDGHLRKRTLHTWDLPLRYTATHPRPQLNRQPRNAQESQTKEERVSRPACWKRYTAQAHPGERASRVCQRARVNRRNLVNDRPFAASPSCASFPHDCAQTWDDYPTFFSGFDGDGYVLAEADGTLWG